MNIWIRADGNDEIASGHLRRTLTIAEALRRQGEEVLFLLADEESRGVFLQLTDADRAGWKYMLLGCAYGDLEGELRRMEELLRVGVPDWLLVDSYAAAPEYYERLKGLADGGVCAAAPVGVRDNPDSAAEKRTGGSSYFALEKRGSSVQDVHDNASAAPGLQRRRCRIACLDDLMAFDPPVDLVINYAPDAAAAEAFYHHAPVRLLGPAYAPLRSQFAGMQPQTREHVGCILISTGGSDPFGMSDAATETVRDALEGTASAGKVELVYTAPGHPYVSNMAALLKKCDLAVSAGGTTLYELCAAGVPAIAFSMADNQQIFAQKMAAAGACTYAGDVRDPGERRRVLQKITQWVRRRCGDTGNSDNDGSVDAGLMLRRREAQRMHALTDGCGADRIAQELRR